MVAFTNMSIPFTYADQAAAIASRESARHVRLGHIAPTDRGDAVQDLILAVLIRWPRFDASRAAFATFCTLVIKREAVSLSRMRRAVVRGGRCKHVSLDQCMATGGIQHALASPDRGFVRVDVRLDVRAIIDRLPAELQHTARLLMSMTASEAARRLSVPRHVILSQINLIRRSFVAAGWTR
jgi:hypothetical protein